VISNIKNKKYEVVITGATGFVGRILIPKIIKSYDPKNILCLVKNSNDELERKGRKLLKKYNVNFHPIDLETGEGMKNLKLTPKLVIHLAANTNTAERNHRVNDVGTKNLLKILKLKRNSHFIHVGTMVSVVGRKDCSITINETSADFPTNEYTKTKVKAEEYLVNECKKDRFSLTIIRPNTIYGKGVREDSLFDIMKKSIVNGSIIAKINWPGKSALIHVEDFTDALILLTKKKPEPATSVKYLIYTQNLSLTKISETMQKKMNLSIDSIILPSWLWKILAKTRLAIPLFENILPYPIYNNLWRFSIIVDDVVYCNTNKFRKMFPEWKPKTFSKYVNDVVI